MTNSESLSLKPSGRVPNWWVGAFLLFSFLGFLDSTYLTAKHYLGFSVNCSLIHGCEEVLNSSYATFFGIPVALAGAIYYVAIFLCLIAFIDRKKFLFWRIATLLPVAGFLVTLWLVGVQAFILQAFCLYCLFSAFFTTILFLLSVYGYHKGIGRETSV